MIGSLGRWYGPVVGVLLFIPTNEFMTTLVSPELGRIALGCLFIVVIILLPRGLGSYLVGRLRGEESVGGDGGTADTLAEDRRRARSIGV